MKQFPRMPCCYVSIHYTCTFILMYALKWKKQMSRHLESTFLHVAKLKMDNEKNIYV